MMADDGGTTASRIDWTEVTFEEACATLREWREQNARRSEETVEMWEHVLSRHPSALGDAMWIVYEQVFLAALDCGRVDLSSLCIDALMRQFGRQSVRVTRLQAMRMEALGQWDQALQVYEALAERDPTNTANAKRIVAVYKAQGRTEEAIEALTNYLTTYVNDNEAWLELSNLYLVTLDYARAAHCFEELLLSQPLNSLYATRYADLRYTQGGLDNVEVAKQYYLHATKMQPANMRAAWGVVLSCNWLAGKTTGVKRKEMVALAQWAADILCARYAQEEVAPALDASQTLKSIVDNMANH